MAEVYKGRHPRLDRTVAIKVLPANLAAEADFCQRFEREARAIAALRHPNIVQVFDFGDVDGTYYMVMEFIDGTDLARLMRGSGPLTLAQTRAVIRDVTGALDYAHALGLVHRDVKPSNVMLQPIAGRADEPPAQRAILTDFGIAKILTSDTAATKTGMMMGTLDYMAPEQIRVSGAIDHRADIYALGAMLYQMLTGELPFKGDNPSAVILAHLQKPAPDPRTVLPDLPENVAQAVLRALAKEPDKRFAAAGDLADALGA
jgi:serine/threonine-protein kinase